MSHPLEQQLAAVRSRARGVLRLYALAWIAAAAALAAVVIAGLDFAIRFQDAGLRWMASLSLVAATAGTAVYVLREVRRVPLTDLALARTIEGRYPGLHDRLSSALVFLRQAEDDRQAGSAALRSAVIHAVTAETEQFDFAGLVRSVPAGWALAAALCMLGLIGAIAWMHPALAATGGERLLLPWSNRGWPKVHALVIRNPVERLAFGDAFEIEVADDSGRLPDEVRIHYRFDDDQPVETVVLRQVGNVATARKEAVTRSFWYRVEGGDDQTGAWRLLSVLARPQIAQLSVVVHPPEYTGRPAVAVERSFRALQGSVVEIVGMANQKLASGAVWMSPSGSADPSIQSLPLAIGADRVSFRLPTAGDDRLEVRETTQYALHLVAESQIASRADERYEIRAIADAAPTVRLEQPAEELLVVPTAQVPIRVVAHDDIALAELQLSVETSAAETPDAAAAQRFVIWSSAEPSGSREAAAARTDLRWTHVWNLESLGVSPPATLIYQALAVDQMPQTGGSGRQRLVVVTAAELDERLSQRLDQLQRELRRGLALQQAAHERVDSLDQAFRAAGRWNQSELELAQATAVAQRQVAKLLTSPREAVRRGCDEIGQMLAINRLDQPEIQTAVDGAAAQLASLEQQQFAVLDQRLTAAIKHAQSSQFAGDDGQASWMHNALLEAGMLQQEVESQLESILDSLARWDDFRRFASDLAGLRAEQSALREQTRSLQEASLGKAEHELDEAAQTASKKIAARQTTLGRQIDRLGQEMRSRAAELPGASAAAAAALADAAEHIAERRLGATMRSAAEQATGLRLALAVAKQDQALADLDEVLAILTQRRERSLTRLVEKLRRAEQELAALQADESQVEAAAERSGGAEEPARERALARLADEQHRLEQRTERSGRELARLSATSASEATGAAARQMHLAGAAGQSGDANAMAAAARQAGAALEQAARAAAAERQRAESELASEQVARLETTITGLRNRQARLVDDTLAVAVSQTADSGPSADALLQVADLAADQRHLQRELEHVSRELAEASAFRLAFDSAGREMGLAADGLEHRETGLAVQQAERAALRRLEQMVAAYQREEPKSPSSPPPGRAGQPNPAAAQAIKQAQRNLAEVKLLRLMQADLGERYREMAESPPGDANRQPHLNALADEQQRLATLALQWVAEPEPTDDESPFPELRLDDDDSAQPDRARAAEPSGPAESEPETRGADDAAAAIRASRPAADEHPPNADQSAISPDATEVP